MEGGREGLHDRYTSTYMYRLFNPPPQFSRQGTQCPTIFVGWEVVFCMCFEVEGLSSLFFPS